MNAYRVRIESIGKPVTPGSEILSNSTYVLYKIPAGLLLRWSNKGKCIRWEGNRKEDTKRVRKIAKHIQKYQRIDGIISLAFWKDKLVCYDGNHRRCAISEDTNTIPVLVSVIWKATDDIIEREFALLNSSISLPSIYLQKKSEHAKLVFVEFGSKLEGKYPTMCKGSRGCYKPNFNRDSLVENLTSISEKERFKHLSPEELVSLIELTNKCYGKEKYGFDKNDIGESNDLVRSKCEKHQFWLFCKGRELDEKYIYKVLKNSK